ncbi:peptidoglycan DD-metalloendopeptidase family protein [Patescibacteria group bacterium]|nr:peptidoglycan DD-metalloendopeptidase family protein [Patescibacteria group bacterium]
MKQQAWLKIIALVVAVCLTGVNLVSADLLSDKQDELSVIQKKIEQQEAELAKVRKQKLTLDNQVKLLDQQIEASQLALTGIDTEIITIGLEKNKINHELVDLEEESLARRLNLKVAIRASYIYSQESLLEIMLSSSSLADFSSRVQSVDNIQNKITSNISALEEIKQGLATKKAVLEDKNVRLLDIRQQRIVEEQSLQVQIGAKQVIVKDLKLSEADYQKKLSEARTEQQAISNEIANLLKATPKQVPVGELVLYWPIASRRITATFHDADYARTFGLTHNAIDIATPQGTPVKAPYDGTVTKIKDGGARGLSYLIINHTNGLATVYMHLSGFAVSTGAFVARGQVIGYSGGTPGTPGAGWLTTGPHLHFEVWYQDQARNPLAYLVN